MLKKIVISIYSVTIHNPDFTLTNLPELALFEKLVVFHVQTSASGQANCIPKEI